MRLKTSKQLHITKQWQIFFCHHHHLLRLRRLPPICLHHHPRRRLQQHYHLHPHYLQCRRLYQQATRAIIIMICFILRLSILIQLKSLSVHIVHQPWIRARAHRPTIILPRAKFVIVLVNNPIPIAIWIVPRIQSSPLRRRRPIFTWPIPHPSWRNDGRISRKIV